MNGKTRALRKDGIIKIITGERFTPYALARKLKARVILESASFKKGRERYSLLMLKEAFRIVQQGREIYMERGKNRAKIKHNGKDILDVLAYFANQHPAIHQDLPMPAGGVGFLSYEFASNCDAIRFRRKEDELKMPDAVFLFGHVFLIFDHYTDILYLLGLNYNENEIDLKKAIAETEEKINDLDFNYLAPGGENHPAELTERSDSKEAFIEGVSRVQEEIRNGNLLQGVLSRRLWVKTNMPALEAYKNLRSTNPSPYLFYIDFDDFVLFGSSPEVHVKVKDDRVLLRPIAGTRKRGKNTEEDRALEEGLLNDEKERAEHLMLVDLARNDLGRICKPGTVKVSEFMGIEHYSHVMHIVSQVEGELAPGRSGIDAVRATFPAGTVSGAPKIKAIEIIDRLERVQRRFYAGLVGYMEPDGNLDTCITIRSACKINGYMILQAGAGIVLDSTPEREYEETGEKLMALAMATGADIL
ncbi:MAG: anthranilate synthase component I [Spirochaetes bacterium]|mgnify:CR=1 FL=1|nr:MAG: anthranilate synthase component I [Spirochaetota bacterium]